ncbi:MAG: ABC transporter substrate-binding protein [Acidisphaera sp.]|nr:ABC transporter substrate-binding protein [Acidisphaera sp.]
MTRLARRLLLRLGLAGLAAPPVLALAQDAAAEQAPIRKLDDAILDVMKAGRQRPFRERYKSLEPALTQAIDIAAVLQGAVGLAWSSIPPAQQGALTAEFQRFTVATYVANFDSFSGERFELDKQLRAVGAEQVVQTRLVRPSGETTRIDYVMRQSDGAWRAVDVLLDGSISRVAVLRSDFRSLLASGDGAALLDSLRRKVSDLSAGTLQ